MEWYFAENGRQSGPVSNEQLEEMVRSGRLASSNLVWRQGMATWQPYASVRAGTTPVASGANTGQCVECGQFFATDDLLHYENSWVCARCKPLFFQRVKEGAAPPASLSLWRSERVLVMSQGGTLPDRCVKCNAPANGQRLLRKLYWHSPYIYLVILVNLLVYAVVAIIVRKRARVEIGLCENHRRHRRLAIGLAWLMVLLGIGGIVAGVANSSVGLGLLGGLLLVVGPVLGAIKGPVVSAKRIDSNFVWIKGVCPAYLDALPEWRDGA